MVYSLKYQHATPIFDFEIYTRDIFETHVRRKLRELRMNLTNTTCICQYLNEFQQRFIFLFCNSCRNYFIFLWKYKVTSKFTIRLIVSLWPHDWHFRWLLYNVLFFVFNRFLFLTHPRVTFLLCLCTAILVRKFG